MKNNFLFLILVAVALNAAPLDCDQFVLKWVETSRIPPNEAPPFDTLDNYECFAEDSSTVTAFHKDYLMTIYATSHKQTVACQAIQKFLSYACHVVDSANTSGFFFMKYGDALKVYKNFKKF